MSDIAIRVENLGKAYRIGLKEQQHETMLGALAAWMKSPLKNFREVRSLSRFEDATTDHRPQTTDHGPETTDHRPQTTDQGPGQQKSVVSSQSSVVSPEPPPPQSVVSGQLSGGLPSDIIWALKDVSFEVKHGEAVGIIGRNGAGKSTLLKILSRITEPTRGRATVYGRVGSLLEVGTGFHPDLTGRENVYLNGTILGMKKREIDTRFDEIVDFSGVEKFIDTPVKRYSSGMRVRLAFAVAAHLEPEILIVDEVLAVGDAEFQKKCLGKMQDVAGQGRTVLFVSHNMAAVENLCSKSLLLWQGQLEIEGPTPEVLTTYLNSTGGAELLLDANECRLIKKVALFNAKGDETRTFRIGEAIRVRLNVASNNGSHKLSFGIGLNDARGARITTLLSKHRAFFISPTDQQCAVECELRELTLAPGNYGLKVTVGTLYEDVDVLETPFAFEVAASDYYGCGILPASAQGPILANHLWCRP